jgi:hypothetical protein
MAGQARRGSRDQGRSSRGAPSWSVLAEASGDASGSAIATSTEVSHREPTNFPTRATYRNLILRGLSPDEAANLTAYLAGIQVGEWHWTLRQINQLLFFREMNRTGYFRDRDSHLH